MTELLTRPLHPLFAAELLGADLREPPSRELVGVVADAVDEYAVLVIRDQRIGDDEHIRFSRAFGPLELPPDLGIAGLRQRLRRELYDASNIDAEGNLLDPVSTRRNYDHEWRDGDLVTWDNRCTMHRAAPFDDALTHVRDLRRTTINEEGPERASTDRLLEAGAR